MNKPSFSSVKGFLHSYGFVPSRESGEKAIIDSCYYAKMKNEGKILYGENFAKFLYRYIVETDGTYHLVSETWNDLEEEFNQEY